MPIWDVRFYMGDLEGCIQHCDQGLSLDGNCAQAHGNKGGALVFAGRRAEGRQSLRAPLRLDPRDPARVSKLLEIAIAQYFDGDFVLSAETSRQVVRQTPIMDPPTGFCWHLWDNSAVRQSVKRS
jgi:hypothetical protein